MNILGVIRNNLRLLIKSNVLKCANLLSSSSATSNLDGFSHINYEAIASNDPDLIKQLKIIALEVNVLRQQGSCVPSRMTDERWNELLQLSTRSQRMKQLRFWFVNEKKRENDRKRKEEKKQLRIDDNENRKIAEEDSGHIRYGIGGSTIFLRVYDTAIDRQLNSKLIQAMMFGQDVVIDCGYDEHMTQKEAHNCAKQLSYLFAENRLHKSPLNLHFCNVNKNGRTISQLHKIIPTLYDPTFPLNVSEKSYLDLFPKERLVYLTPHCREEMKCYNSDDVYIVGAMVDKVNNQPLSLAKAKAQGLRMAKFPIDRYLSWDIGTKSLTLNQVVKILLDLKETGDWREAFKHVPQRKLKTGSDVDNRVKFRNKIRMSSFFK